VRLGKYPIHQLDRPSIVLAEEIVIFLLGVAAPILGHSSDIEPLDDIGSKLGGRMTSEESHQLGSELVGSRARELRIRRALQIYVAEPSRTALSGSVTQRPALESEGADNRCRKQSKRHGDMLEVPAFTQGEDRERAGAADEEAEHLGPGEIC